MARIYRLTLQSEDPLLVSLAGFTGLVTWALVWRRHREWHRRLIVVVSIMIIGSAIARLERVGFVVPVPAVLIGLLVALGVNDTIRVGRVHRATVVSALVVMVSLGALVLVVGTRIGEGIIEHLTP